VIFHPGEPRSRTRWPGYYIGSATIGAISFAPERELTPALVRVARQA
jgi:hypothetical protein